jgi:hypothetical protein
MRTVALVGALLVGLPGLAFSGPAPKSPTLDEATAVRLARLALDCVHREYPNKISHVLNSDADVKPPRLLTPAFYGCYDWHSAVHGHWLLARLARTSPAAAFAKEARTALAKSLSPANIAGEVAYLSGPGRATFERPYGLAWLLLLSAELREWDEPQARAWAETLRPLEKSALARLTEWIPKLSYPIREGEHAQTAFAFGLILDWARAAKDPVAASLVERKVLELYVKDAGCPLSWEPSGQDFLSPCLAEADLLRRVLPPARYAVWLSSFLPSLPSDGSREWLTIAVTTDPSDGKLAHLDGLNLSRAFMLDGIAAGLPPGDPRVPALKGAARTHLSSGFTAVSGGHYEGSHWLGTFAVYALTGRGLRDAK